MATGTELLGARGAEIHPRLLRWGPWTLSVVVAGLFAVAFATSYAALYDYALELGFGWSFAVAFPLVLDAVIVVLAVALLLERALGRRTFGLWGLSVRVPPWPMLALWLYFAGSVAGNVGHAPAILAAQLVAAVPPVSAALTFHLLLRLLDRAASMRQVAEEHDERRVEEAERAARRQARKSAARVAAPVGSNGHRAAAPAIEARAVEVSAPNGSGERADEAAPAAPVGRADTAPTGGARRGSQRAEAWAWYQARRAEGVEPTAPDLARHLGCSDGQARKLRAHCEERWRAELRAGLHVVGADQ